MAEIQVSRTGSFNATRWAARIVSLLPGAGVILSMWGVEIHYYFATGNFQFPGPLFPTVIYGLPLLGIGLLAWKWPRAGGILLILGAAVFFSFAWFPGKMLDPTYGSFLGAASLIGGILHLVVSPWGRRLWHKEQ